MAASAYPSGNQDGTNAGPVAAQGGGDDDGGAGNPSDGVVAVRGGRGLKHNPGNPNEPVVWTAKELAILEEGLTKYAACQNVICYAKISLELKTKSVRDVAMRSRWMSKKESGKRRKEDHSQPKKNKENKEKVTDSSTKPSAHLSLHPGVSPYSLPMLPFDDDDDISSKEIGGPAGQLLEQNSQVLNQISANFSSCQIQDNIDLFCQVRDNIFTIINDASDMPEIMKQMPQLPVKLNEELASSILPGTSTPAWPPLS